MKNENDQNRRRFLSQIASIGLGAICATSVSSKRAMATEAESKTLRLDSHVHVPSRKAIKPLADYVAHDGITHYVAILPDLGLIDELRRTVNACCIPFYRVRKPLEQPVAALADLPIAGYKLQLRHPTTYDSAGSPVAATEKHLGAFCEAAGKLGRPILFHTDADEPDICSLPMLADLARRHPETTFIAAHWGMYSQEYEADKSTPRVWEVKLRGLVSQNVKLILEVNNLYADVALLGRDFPERSADPEFKLKLLVKEIGGLSAAERLALSKKLFIGVDFPAFRTKNDPKIGYLYQRDCVRRIFGEAYDESQTVGRFLSLVPAAFAGRT